MTHRVHELFSHGKIIPDLLCAPEGVPQSSMMVGTMDLSVVFSLSTRYFHNVASVNNYGNHHEELKWLSSLIWVYCKYLLCKCHFGAFRSARKPLESSPEGGSGTEKWLSGSLQLPKGDVCASLLIFFLVELIFLFSLSHWKYKNSAHHVCICWRIVYEKK